MSVSKVYEATERAKRDRAYVLSEYRKAISNRTGEIVGSSTVRDMYREGELPPVFPVPAVTKPAYFHLNYDGFEGIYIETPNSDVLVGWFNEP